MKYLYSKNFIIGIQFDLLKDVLNGGRVVPSLILTCCAVFRLYPWEVCYGGGIEQQKGGSRVGEGRMQGGETQFEGNTWGINKKEKFKTLKKEEDDTRRQKNLPYSRIDSINIAKNSHSTKGNYRINWISIKIQQHHQKFLKKASTYYENRHKHMNRHRERERGRERKREIERIVKVMLNN